MTRVTLLWEDGAESLPEHHYLLEAVPGVGNVGKLVLDTLVNTHPSRTVLRIAAKRSEGDWQEIRRNAHGSHRYFTPHLSDASSLPEEVRLLWETEPMTNLEIKLLHLH